MGLNNELYVGNIRCYLPSKKVSLALTPPPPPPDLSEIMSHKLKKGKAGSKIKEASLFYVMYFR